MLFYVRMFLRTVFKKMHAEISVQLGSDILVPLKWLVCIRGFVIFPIYLFDIKSRNSQETPTYLFLFHAFLKRKCRVNNRVFILCTVDLKLTWKLSIFHVSFNSVINVQYYQVNEPGGIAQWSICTNIQHSKFICTAISKSQLLIGRYHVKFIQIWNFIRTQFHIL